MTPRATQQPTRYGLALRGIVPAEDLPTEDRGRLLWALCSLGWTDRQIAEWTRTTDYTVHRILTAQAALRSRDGHPRRVA